MGSAENATARAPWRGAELHEGTVPQQASLFPRPVVLACRSCGAEGFWYPAENRIETASRHCHDGEQHRKGHDWAVYRWNGSVPVDAPLHELHGR